MATNKFIIKMDPADLVPKSSARVYYFIALWVVAIQGLTIGLLWKHLPARVPLFFTEPWGEARLAAKIYLFLIPLIAFGTIVVNLIIGKSAKEVSVVLTYTLAIASLFVVIMLSLAMGGIVQSII